MYACHVCSKCENYLQTHKHMIIKFRKVTLLTANNLRIECVISFMKKVVVHTLTLDIIMVDLHIFVHVYTQQKQAMCTYDQIL